MAAQLGSCKKRKREFYKWLKETKEKIGRKANVIGRIAEHLKIRDTL